MKTGMEIIEAIVNRLDDKDIRCYDSAIVSQLRQLTKYELNQLVTFGDIDEWVKDRNEYGIHTIKSIELINESKN